MGSSSSRFGTAFFFYAHLSEDYLFSGAPTTHSCSIHALLQICNWLLRHGLAPLSCLQPQDSGFHMIHSTDEGFCAGAPHFWIYWHFLADVVLFQISPAILTLFSPIFISQTDPICSLISFIFLFLFYWSIYMPSLNCLNIVIMIHLKSLSKIFSRSFLLGVIVLGWAALQGDILSWFLMLFYFCAEFCESEIFLT